MRKIAGRGTDNPRVIGDFAGDQVGVAHETDADVELEAFADEPPEPIIFENVPRIANRGRHLLDQIGELLRAYGYAVAETTHDCGELGDGLGQSRRRFLLVARLVRKVPPFLYEPPKRGLRSVGDVLQHVPLPGDAVGGPMHMHTWGAIA